MDIKLTAMIAAITMTAALSAAAEVIAPTVAYDPLMKMIMSMELNQLPGRVTGSKLDNSGKTTNLDLPDPLAPLKPVVGLVERPPKAKARRKTRRAAEQLKTMSEDKRRADWSGRQ